jgi:Mg2+-importing ATPase
MAITAAPAPAPAGLGLVEAARLPPAEVLARTESTAAGLSDQEHTHRLAAYGPNAIRSHGATPFAILWRQLRNPLLILLAAATVVSFLTGEHTDALIIMGIVALSVGLGFFNEFRSERVVEALHNSIRHRTLVVRGGAAIAVDVTDLVPGDVVLLRTGDLVPADLRLLEARELEADEAVLTGEAMPRTKSADADSGSDLVALGLRSIAYMGTTIRGGSGKGVVVQTGSRTEFGKIALRLGERQPVTAFQRGLGAFSTLLVRVTAVLAGSIFVLNIVLGRSVLESALFALAIAVGLTPQLLPAIVTVSLASGARILARKRVVVKRLISIEDLGNIEVLFTDKTGTLTEGRITFREAMDPSGKPSDAVRDLALIASSLGGPDSAASGNALDEALAEAGSPPQGWERLDFLPFDHDRRLVSAIVRRPDGSTILVTKGAPESVLARSVTPASQSQQLLDGLFSQGARVVAVGTRPWAGPPRCTTQDERDLELAGFITFLDAPKADAAVALQQLRALGVEVKIVTGDNPLVAVNVCRTLGLDPGDTLTGPDIDKLSDDELRSRIPGVGVFARVSPEQKSRIIEAQQRAGKDVGFLGDGVNDAVALRDADVGISVDSGSDVAKDAADIVMLGKDLNILAGGVLEGRRIFSNTMKYVLMGTSSNFGNMFSAAAGSLLLDFLPMTPTQILLNNLLYDTGEMTIPTDNVDAELLERPAQWDIRLIRRFMMFFGPISSVFDFITFGVMLFVFHARGSLFQTAWFTESLCTQSLVIFAIRTRRVPFFRSRPSAWLVAGTLGSVTVGLILPFTPIAPWFGFSPLPAAFLAILFAMVVVYMVLVEVGKTLFFGRVSRAPRLPIKLWEHTPGHRQIERLASRWSLPRWTARRPKVPTT